MKEAIGGTWLFQIVIVFILLFAGYMCLTINHNKAFAIKSEIIESLSRNGGVNKSEITDILSKASYRTSGSCRKYNKDNESEWDGVTRDGVLQKGGSNSDVFCVRKIVVSGGNPELPERYYYQVRVFYQLDLPVFNSLFSFTVKGDTSSIYGESEGVEHE